MSDTPSWSAEEVSRRTGGVAGGALDLDAAARRMAASSIPSMGEQLVRFGGAAMVLSALLSWITGAPDAFPNTAGVGVSTGGHGLMVFLAGLALLLRSPKQGLALGGSIGAFTVTLIFVVKWEQTEDAPSLGLGPWVAIAGAIVVFIGAVALRANSNDNHRQEVDVLTVLTGSILTLVSSIALAWLYTDSFLGTIEGDAISGLHTEVITGIPVLVISATALLLIFALQLRVRKGHIDNSAIHNLLQMCGIAVMLLAGSHVFGGIMIGALWFNSTWLVWSGPIGALLGGVVIVSSVRQVD